MIKVTANIPSPINRLSEHHSIDVWRSGAVRIKWTFKELDAADPQTGYIGNRNGVDCYIYPNPDSRKFLIDTLNGLRK